MEELDLSDLVAIPEDAITIAEAKEIDDIWNRSTANTYYHNEVDEAQYHFSEFTRSIQHKGEKFMLKAYKYLLYDSGNLIPISEYDRMISLLLERGIERIENYLKKIQTGAIRSIKVAEASTTDQAQYIAKLEAEIQRLKDTNSTEPPHEDIATALKEENEALKTRVSELEENIKQLTKGKGKKSPSGLNRTERTALLVEVIAGVTGLTTEEITGATAKIQGQGVKALGRVCELITDISERQGYNVLTQYREYQRERKHEVIDEGRLRIGLSQVKALAKEVKDMQKAKQVKR